MPKAFSGLTKINKIDVPFSFDWETESLTLHFGNAKSVVEIPDGMDTVVGEKLGVTSGNYFFKLSIPLSTTCITVTNNGPKNVAVGNQIREIDYFVENYKIASRYTELRFRFSELDWFLPSVGLAKSEEDYMAFSSHSNTAYSFDIKYRDDVISVSFIRGVTVHLHTKATAETFSEVALKFPETNDLEYISNLYLTARGFFEFVCNRQNIGLRDACLKGTYAQKVPHEGNFVERQIITEQKLFYNQKYLEPIEDVKQLKKVPNSALFASKLKELFQLFFEETAGNGAVADIGSIHPSFKYRNLIDLEQSLQITAAFEYYVRKLLPEISSNETIEFYDDIKQLLDGYIGTAKGKKRKKAKDFKKSLRPQISLEEKVLNVFGGYGIWQPLTPILLERFGDDVSRLATTVNLWRNELAHGKREFEPTIDVIDAIRLVEHINYCIVLRHAGYTDAEIKDIISTVLTK